MFNFTEEEILMSELAPTNINNLAAKISIDLQRKVDEQLMRFVDIRGLRSGDIIDVKEIKLPQHLNYTQEISYHITYNKNGKEVSEPVVSSAIFPDFSIGIKVLYED